MTKQAQVDLRFWLCLNSRMTTLDNDDFKALKNLMVVTIEEVIESKGLVTKDDIGHLPTKDEFYSLFQNSR